MATGPASIEILPSAGQPPYCLVFTVSEKGIVRQLTMSPSNESIPCAAGQPIGGTAYRIPPAEGKVRVHVILSDRKLDATPIAGQVRELGRSPGFSAMDLRAPGRVVLETLRVRQPSELGGQLRQPEQAPAVAQPAVTRDAPSGTLTPLVTTTRAVGATAWTAGSMTPRVVSTAPGQPAQVPARCSVR